METSQAHFTKYMKENFANTSTYQKKKISQYKTQ